MAELNYKNGSFLILAGSTLGAVLATLKTGVTGDLPLAPLFFWFAHALDSESCAVLFLSPHGIGPGSDFLRSGVQVAWRARISECQ